MGKKTISNTFSVNTIYDGEDAVVATCSPDKISIQCNADGSVVSTNGYSVSFGLKVGSIDISQYITDVTRGSLPTGVSISSTPVASAKTIVVSNTATATGMASGITFTVTGTYEGKTYSSTVNVALVGAKQGGVGERGKVGRFFYFGGTFDSSDSDPTHTFVVNDAQAPYFEHTETATTQSGTTTIKRYHVFNYQTNGSYTMAQMWSISSSSWNNSPWEAMTNDFKYIISEALFANFAKLGSFIISGDWMLSTNGKINGTDYNDGAMYNGASAYTWFDPAYPNVDHTKTVTIGGQQVTVHNFIPNFCVDGLTGKTYQNDAYIKGTIHATDGEFNGTIKTEMMYSKCQVVDELTTSYTIFESYQGAVANTFKFAPYRGTLVVTLPNTGDYESLELRFLCTVDNMAHIQIKPKTGDSIYYEDFNGGYGWHYTTTGIAVAYDCMVIIQCVSGAWYVIGGKVTTI